MPAPHVGSRSRVPGLAKAFMEMWPLPHGRQGEGDPTQVSLRGGAGGRRQAAGWRQGSPRALGPQTGRLGLLPSWARASMEGRLTHRGCKPFARDGKVSGNRFPSVVPVGSAHRRCRASVSLRHVMDTPPPLRVATQEFPGTAFSGRRSQRLLHAGTPSSAEDGERGVPVLRALRSRPLLSLPLSARPAPVPGGGSARRAARPASWPTFAPGRRVQNESPEWGRCAGPPCTRKAVSSSRLATPGACVGERGARGARPWEGLAAAGAGTDSPGRARAAPHTNPRASLLTPTPPTPLSSHPHRPGPLPAR